ncbi:MAG: class I SAM-dependent methyltransferase [Rhodospirillaceae bacterium]|nr:class I SAM-dependent methyltransferase [Rhodospirillaceae bacterium]
MSMTTPEYIRVAIASPNRMGADLRRDPNRKPAEVMTFLGIKPGDRVAELMAGTGYHAGLLCEIVGTDGKVYAHNTPGSVARRNGNPLRTRVDKCDLTNMELMVCPCDQVSFPEALDAVLFCTTYHDTVWTGVDRTAMNGALFNALKPGGVLAVIDHNAKAGAGLTHAKTYHRVEKDAIIADVTAAGFVFEGENTALENPADTLEIDVHDDAIGGNTSRFILKFRKPV